MGRLLVISMLSTLILSCQVTDEDATSESILTEVAVNLKDSIARKILDHQDRSEVDSLASFMDHPDPTYRYLAACALGSVQSDKYLDQLIAMLQDPVRKVQQASAFALGQIGAPAAEGALLAAFDNVVDSSEDVNHMLNATILEAIGKCSRLAHLDLLSQVSTYGPNDHLLLLGQARAIYRYMQRNMITPSGTQKMVSLLADPEVPEEVRMLAANYLSRAEVDLSAQKDVLALIYTSETDVNIKMFLPFALTKTHDKNTISLLYPTLQKDEDFRLQCNVIKAIGAHDFGKNRRIIQQMLRHKNIQVACTAAETILKESDARYWKSYMTLSLGNYPWQVKTKLLHAVSKFIPGGNNMFLKINQDLIRQRIRQSKTPEEKAAAISALAAYPGNYSSVIGHLDAAKDHLVRTTAFESLATLASSPRFRRIGKTARQAIINRILQGLQSGDVAQVAISAHLLSNQDIRWSNYGVEPTALLKNALSSLQLPRDSEAFLAVQEALAKYSDEQERREDLPYTHAIEWSALTPLHDSIRASIETSRGSIEISLYAKQAPASVANFIDLANLNYYAGKTIHRVVPGFVIQGGCNRGDGYGSMDYNIRSELSQVYYNSSGKLGMASAGSHTESAQWFITQGPTPHLDGRYTLFGEVNYGMSVVNQIQAGDTITKITIR